MYHENETAERYEIRPTFDSFRIDWLTGWQTHSHCFGRNHARQEDGSNLFSLFLSFCRLFLVHFRIKRTKVPLGYLLWSWCLFCFRHSHWGCLFLYNRKEIRKTWISWLWNSGECGPLWFGCVDSAFLKPDMKIKAWVGLQRPTVVRPETWT